MLYFCERPKTKYRKNKIIPSSREEFQIIDDEKYNHSTQAVRTLMIGSTRKSTKIQMKKNNPVIREKFQILDDDTYNYSTRAVQVLIIGSTRKPTKSKCSKNEIIPSPPRKFK
jgi:hypothetical protein